MGRPGLTRHRKFARLARLLESEALARGHLELLWEVAYENGDELLGDAGDVEFAARWQGKPGELAAALVESGFLDCEGDVYRVHDLWDHAPDYVQKRAEREAERRAKGETISSLRAEAGRKGGLARAAKVKANGKQTAGKCQANGATPAPAPAPAPARQPARARAGGGPAGADTRLAELREMLGVALRLGRPLDIGTADGMDEDAVVAFFEAEIAAADGMDETVARECYDLAQKSTTGTPTTLGWFVGWMRRLPRRAIAAAAGGGAA